MQLELFNPSSAVAGEADHGSLLIGRASTVVTLLLCSLFVGGLGAADDEFAFDVGGYEKAPFEFRGYAEIEPTYSVSNEDGALYQLEFFDESEKSTIWRLPAVLEMEGRYHQGITTLSFRTHSSKVWDYRHESAEHKLYEGLLSVQPGPGFNLDVGKKAYRWGKGYAWNPVAFVERAKDAGNPDLAREGFWTVGFDWIKSFDGPLQTVAFTPLVLPHHSDINNDFGEPGHNNLAAKLYLLYRDTDIDFMFLDQGSRSARYGMDFARNITANFEVHGELAYIKDSPQRKITANCSQGPKRTEDVWSYLLGLRYRTEDDATLIFEYYYNGAGNSEEDQRQFYRCVHKAWETGDDRFIRKLPLDSDLDKGPFTKPNPMRRYLNFRAWWSEPYDILYFTPGVQLLYNVDDDSFSVAPELNYDVTDNLNVRFRVSVPFGDELTEWGEKPNDYKTELRLRLYF